LPNEDNVPDLPGAGEDLPRCGGDLIAGKFTTRLAPIRPVEGCAEAAKSNITPICGVPSTFKHRIAARQRALRFRGRIDLLIPSLIPYPLFGAATLRGIRVEVPEEYAQKALAILNEVRKDLNGTNDT
jgi:hypothetical protein